MGVSVSTGRVVLGNRSADVHNRTGTVEFMPIHFMHKSVAFEELIALYAVSDVCLVSSTRDGMNLVSYEYIATQQKRHGVMILSEFTGAAQSLNGSIVVNPWNTEELANAIHEAITLPADLRKANHEKLYAYVTKYTRYELIYPALVFIANESCVVLSGASPLSLSLPPSPTRPKRAKRTKRPTGSLLWVLRSRRQRKRWTKSQRPGCAKSGNLADLRVEGIFLGWRGNIIFIVAVLFVIQVVGISFFFL